MQCEMCGRDAALTKARIEGSELDVCPACVRFGKVIATPQAPRFARPQQLQKQNSEELLSVVDDYWQRIRQSRERLDLTQEDFAKKVAEKHSLMQKIEAGSNRPSIALARKLENLLHIKLLVTIPGSAEGLNTAKNKSAGFTIADFIKTKKET
ncbi:TIGR00270 family protein [Candidatus Woesearchaeota archaeon]|nr:TIGR00270 family protein [Candidatus Woesearchaeota archaeon]